MSDEFIDFKPQLAPLTVNRGGIKYGQPNPALEKAQREIKALRQIIHRHAADAEMVRRQEKVHDYCEGHALCDLVASCIYDADSLSRIPYERNPDD